MARVADQPRLNLHCRHAAARDALGVARGGDVALDDAKTHTRMQDARGLFQQGGLAAARRRSPPSVARTSSVAAPSTGPARRISNAKARASGTTPLRAPTQTPICRTVARPG